MSKENATQDRSVALVARGLSRLEGVLPLKKRQELLPRPLIDIHRRVLRSFADRGHSLSRREIAEVLGDADKAEEALAILASDDLIVRGPLVGNDAKGLDAKGGEVVGAYPFTTQETPHRITIAGHQVHAMCAVDALAISAIFHAKTHIESRCYVTCERISIRQDGKQILDVKPSCEVRVGVRWQKVTGCAAHSLCREMVFLKSGETASTWRASDPTAIDIFSLREAVEFGEEFFMPLLNG